MRNVLGIALIVMTAGVVPAQITGDAADEIKSAVTSYDNAWNAKDRKSVDQKLAARYVYFTSNGGTTDRKRTLEFLMSTDYKLTFVERTEVEVLHVDRTVAIVSSRWKGKGTFGKEPIDDDQRCGLVFVREGKIWKLLSEHCTQITK